MITRETIYAALFTTIQTALQATGVVVTIERKLRHWTDVRPTEQPYVGVVQGNQRPTVTQRRPTVWNLEAQVYIYTHRESTDEIPATQLNRVLDEIEKLFLPSQDKSYVQTLGLANVQNAWLSGAIETDEGLLGDQAVAIVPIEILVL